MKNVTSFFRNVFQNRDEEPGTWQNHLSSIQKERRATKRAAYYLGVMGAKTLPILNKKLDAFLERTQTSAEADLEITSSALQAKLGNIEREIQDNPLNSQVTKSYHGGRFPVKDLALSILDRGIARRTESLSIYRTREKDVSQQLETLERSAASPVTGFWSKPAGQIALAALVAIGEFILLVPILEATGTWGTTIELYLFAAVLTSLMTASSHVSAQFLADRKPVLGALSISAGLILIGALSFIRWNDGNAPVYLMVNISFFLLGILVAYHGYKTTLHAALSRQRRRLISSAERTAKSLSRLEGWKEGIHKISQRQAVRQGYRLKETLATKRDFVKERQAKVDAKQKTLSPFFDSLRVESEYDFQLSYARGKRQRWLIVLFIGLTFLFLTGCTSPMKDEYRDIFIVFDASRSNSGSQPSSEAVFRKVDRILRLNERRNGRYGVNIYMGSIGESKVPQIRRISLAPGEPYLTRTEKERTHEIQAFQDTLKSAIRQTLLKPRREHMTRAGAGLCYFLHHMMQEPAPEGLQRSVLIYSDLVEASPLYSFPASSYKASFLEKNYERIAKKMKAECKMPILTGVTFEICHQPPVHLEDQFLAASAFWRAFLLEHEASDVKISGGIE